MRIEKKRGIPFVAYKYKKRTGIAVGILFFLIFLTVMSNFIWHVEIKGNERIPAQSIINELESMGIKTGAFIPKINTKKSEYKLQLAFEEIGWAAINIQGSRAVIEIHERDMPPEYIDLDTPCNIIASDSGQIKYMEVYVGQKVKAVNDTVEKGELIVSGIMEDKKGHNMFRHSRAKIIAIVEQNINIEVPLNEEQKIITGNIKTNKSLNVLGFILPLHIYKKPFENFDKSSYNQKCYLLGFELPFEIICDVYEEYKYVNVNYDNEQAKAVAVNLLSKAESQKLNNIEIIQRDLNAKIENNKFILSATYKCLKNIAQKQEILKNS